MPALRTRDTQPRSLEVTTDAPQPPSLSIISPTPRAFSFSVNMPASASPYASPSHSPFEPDLRSLSISSSSSCITPTTLAPESPFALSPSTPTPFSQQHKRRKSSCTTIDLERRPKRGDEDYVKRPENAFILFRRHCCEERQASIDEAASVPTKKERQADLSKSISQRWKGLSAEVRQHWESRAKEAKKKHEEMYPNYVYRPQRKDKDRSKLKKSKRGDLEEDELDTINVMVPVPQPYRHGRFASAPTPPPPYQQIQVPNVYSLTPPCPTSPSLMPMISRRTSHPAYQDEASSFDYIPNDNFSFSHAGGQLEASIQSSEFLRSMFSVPVDPRDSLHPLHIPQDAHLQLPHSALPPTSPMVSPLSPLDPSTPAQSIAQSFSLVGEPRTQADIDLQMQHCYPTYWDPSVLWPTNTEMFSSDDFDLTAIPPIELGIPKFPQAMELEISHQYGGQYGEIMTSSQYCDDSQIQDVMAFDDMMGSDF